MTQPPVATSEATAAQVQDRARELGITWRLRPATVTSGDNPDAVTVVMDGDITPLLAAAVSLDGPHRAGARVMVLMVPPSGLYVIGLYGGNIPRQMTTDQIISPDAVLTLSVTETLVPGTLITATLKSAGRFAATAFFDFEETVLGASTCIGLLYVDGAAAMDEVTGAARNALFEMATTADRATIGQQWIGDLTAGVHTFELYANVSVALGTQRVNQRHTTLRVSTYE